MCKRCIPIKEKRQSNDKEIEDKHTQLNNNIEVEWKQ